MLSIKKILSENSIINFVPLAMYKYHKQNGGV